MFVDISLVRPQSTAWNTRDSPSFLECINRQEYVDEVQNTTKYIFKMSKLNCEFVDICMVYI